MDDFFAYSQFSIRAKPRIRQPNASHNFNAPITVAFPSTYLQPVLQPIFRRKEHPETRLPSAAASPLQEKQSHTFIYRHSGTATFLFFSSLSRYYTGHIFEPSFASTKNPSRQLERPGPRTIRQNEHTAKNTFSCLPKERKQRHNSVAFILTNRTGKSAASNERSRFPAFRTDYFLGGLI